MKIIRGIIYLFFFLALFASICWYQTKKDWEPVVTTFTLVASIFAIIIEQWITDLENKKQLLRSLDHELRINISILDDIKKIKVDLNEFKNIPQFVIFNINQVICSKYFSSKVDKDFHDLLIQYQLLLLDFNSGLRIQELEILISNFDQKKINSSYKNMIDSRFPKDLNNITERIANKLKEMYKSRKFLFDLAS